MPAPPKALLQQKGVRILRDWILLAMERGIPAAAGQVRQTDQLAAQLVDFKLPGIARQIRQWKLKELPPERLVYEVSLLQLWLEGFSRKHEFDQDRQWDLEIFAGTTIRKDSLLTQAEHADRWTVTGLSRGEEEDLHWQRTWLFGENTRQWAYLLDFAWRNAPFPHTFPAGSHWEGSVYYYPGSFPQRCIFQPRQECQEAVPALPPSYEDLSALREAFGLALSRNPFLVVFPACLSPVRILVEDGHFLARFESGTAIPLSATEESLWNFYVLGNEEPLSLFCEWDGFECFPVSVLWNQNWLIL